MADPLTADLVRQVGDLAELELTEDEVAAFTPQLDAILAYAREIQSLDTSGVPPTTHVLAPGSVLRDDVVEPSLPTAQTVRNAPEPAPGGYFKVPRVIGG